MNLGKSRYIDAAQALPELWINLGRSRYFRAAQALPELWFVLALLPIFAFLRLVLPPSMSASMGWEVHPYQVLAVCTGLAWFMLPGAMLFRLLRLGGSWPTRLPSYMAAAIGVWVPLSLLVASSGRFDVGFLIFGGVLMTALLAVAAYLRELRSTSEPDAALDEGRTDLGDHLNPWLVLLAILGLVAMIWISFTATVALDDNLQVMYVQDNLVVPHINEFEPVFGAGIRPHTRGSLTTWPLNLTVITFISGLPAQQAFWLLRTPLVVLNLLAIYALTLRLFGKRNQALLTALFYLLLAVILTNDADAIGFGLFARNAQDKFVARYTLLPMALAWSLAYLKKPDYRAYLLAGACTIGLATTHPIGVILLGIPLGGLGVMHLINHLRVGDLRLLRQPFAWARDIVRRNWPVLRPLLFLSVFSLLGVIVPLLSKSSPDAPVVAYSLTDTRDPTLWFRINLVVNSHRIFIDESLGPEAYIVHPSVFLDPIIILPALGLLLMWWKARRHLVTELVIGTFLLNPAILLIPPVVQLIGSRATPWMLYRFAWPLTLLGPIVIVWGVWSLLEWLSVYAPTMRDRVSLPPAFLNGLHLRERIQEIQASIPGAIRPRDVIEGMVSALPKTLREQLRYRRPVLTVLVALPPLLLLLTVIALRGDIKRGLTILSEYRLDSFSSSCRTLQPLYSKLPELVGKGTVVLSTSDHNFCMVSSAAYAYPVEFGLTTTLNRFPESRIPEAQQRLNDVFAFTFAEVVDQEFMDILARWNVGLILLRADHPLESQLRHMPQFFKLELAADRHQVYRVLPAARTTTISDAEVRDPWKTAHWEGEDLLVTANTYWSQRRWDQAIQIYQALLGEAGDRELLSLIGLGRAHLSAGHLEEALAAFTQATEASPDSIQAWILAGNVYWLQGEYQLMAYSYLQALGIMNWHPLALSRAGDAFRFSGDIDQARAFYELSVLSEVPTKTSAYYRSLGSTFLSVNLTEDAISALKKAISIRGTLLDYSLISEAYLNLNHLSLAEESARSAKKLDRWSDLSNTIQGKVDLERSDNASAIRHFQRAIIHNAQSTTIHKLAAVLSETWGDKYALEEIQNLIGYKLGFADPLLAAAQLQFSLGRIEESVGSAESAWKWKPVDSRAAIFLGNAELVQGEMSQAESYFNSAIAVNPFVPDPFIGLASLAQLEGETGTAVGWAWTAMTRSANNPDGTIAVGKIMELRGENEEAYYTYQRAKRIAPFAPRPYVIAGKFQSGQNQFENATDSFYTALAVQSDSVAAYRELGAISHGQGQLSEAAEAFNKAIQLHPAEGANRVGLAEILVQAGNPDAAIQQLQLVIEQDPGHRPAYLNLGDIYMRLGETAEAETVYRQLIDVMPMFEEGYLRLGQLYERRNDLHEASAIYQLGLKRVAPDISGSISLALADLLRRQGQLDKARDLYQASITQQPMFAPGYVALSRSYAQRGDLSSASQILERGLNLMPPSPELNEALASVRIGQGSVDAALETYQTALALAPSAENLVIGQAKLYASLGQPDKALQVIEQAHQTWSGNSEVLDQGTSLAISIGQAEAGKEMALKLVALAPGFASSWVNLGEAHAALAQFDDAEVAFQQATIVEPGDSRAWFALGEFFGTRDKTAQAIEALQRAAELDQQWPAPHLALAAILDRQGFLQEAVSHYQIAAELDKTQNAALLSLGRIKQREGKLSEAQRYYDQAIETSPTDPQAYQARAGLYLLGAEIPYVHLELLKATEMAPGDCRTFLNLGDFLASREDWPGAAESYEQVLGLSGCRANALIGLGNISIKQGDRPGAIERYTQAIEESPGDPPAYIALSNEYISQATWEKARATYDLAALRMPASPLLQAAISGSLIERGELQKGLEAAKKGVELAPSSAPAAITLGRAYQALADKKLAEANYQRAAEIDLTDPTAYLLMGDLYMSRAIYHDALAMYQQAIHLAPIEPRTYQALGAYFQNRGLPDIAVQLYFQGYSVNKSRIESLLLLERVYQRMGDLEGAEGALRLALGLQPEDPLPFSDISHFEASYEPPGSSAEAYIVLASLYSSQLDAKAAEASYKAAIERGPGEVTGYISLGRLFQQQNRLEEAQSQYETAVQMGPGSGPAHVALGEWYRSQGNWEKAQQALETAIEVAPGYVIGHARLGNFYWMRNQPNEAFEQIRLATKIAPSSAIGFIALGDWQRLHGDWQSAMESYRMATETAAGDPGGYLALGKLLLSRGKHIDSLANFVYASGMISPDSPAPIMALGDWYRIHGDLESAEQWYQQATINTPGKVEAHIRLGDFYQLQGLPGAAMEQYETALAINPSSQNAQIAIGDWFTQNVDREDAVAVFQESKQEAVQAYLDAESPEAVKFGEYMIAGWDYLNTGEVEQAYEQFEAAIEVNPDSVLPYVAMGDWYVLVSEMSSAEQAYQEAIDLAPGEIGGYLRLGKLYMQESRYEEARQKFQAALEAAPGSAQVYLALGDWYHATGDWEQAEAHYIKATQLAPGYVLTYLKLGAFYQSLGRREQALEVYEAALVAGLAPETIACGPGRLPSDLKSSQETYNPAGLNYWRCQWGHRMQQDTGAPLDEGK